jgi:hypothetical protein
MESLHPALDELQERLAANGSTAEPFHVASAILDLSHQKNWNKSPSELIAWLEQLAFDVAKYWKPESPVHAVK